MATPIPRNEATFTLEEVARATTGALRAGAGDARVRGIVIDSRAIEPGNLFVAIEGERHDAHRFLDDVVAAGAGGVVVRRGASVPPGVPALEVDDTLRALGDLAAAHRTRWGGHVVAITGSAGKTTTKELVASALGATGARVLRTRGNLNNLVGLPMSVLELSDEYDVAVLELGTNRPGEIARLAHIARPAVGVVTLVAAAHTEGLGRVEDVAREKAALLMALDPGGVAVAYADDGTLAAWADLSPARRCLFFGRDDRADVCLLDWSIDSSLGTRCELDAGGKRLSLRLELLGEAAALNAAAAVATALASNVDLDRATAGIQAVSPAAGRLRPLEAGGVVVLDDSYNANPRSTAIALDTLAAVARVRNGRPVAVLGDMLELGERSEAEHEAIGTHAVRAGVAVLGCCGTRMSAAVAPAKAAGVDVWTAHSSEEASRELETRIAPGDVVLVKGSRSMTMEKIVDSLVNSSGGR